MKFNEWSKKRIALGIKKLTSRSKPHEDSKDVDYIVGPLPWKFIKRFLFRDEGAFSPTELQKVINRIHRREVKDDKMMYVHVLKEKKNKNMMITIDITKKIAEHIRSPHTFYDSCNDVWVVMKKVQKEIDKKFGRVIRRDDYGKT